MEEYLTQYYLSDIVSIEHSIVLEPFVATHMPPLGRGEAEAMSIAFQKDHFLVIDDKKARNYANRHGVKAYRTGAFVVLAHCQGTLNKREATILLTMMKRVSMYNERQYNLFLADL